MKSSTPFCLLAITCVLPFCIAAQVATPSPARRAVKEVEKEIKLGEDEPGCKDSALLPRVPGCSIIQCDTKPEAEGIEIQIGITPEGVIQKDAMDGAAETTYYLCPARVTPMIAVKTAEANLIKAGYKIIQLGHDGEDFPIVTANKETQWIQVSTYMYNENAAYVQTAIKVAAEDQAASDGFAEEMNKTGKVVISTLPFEKDDLGPNADKVMADVLAFLVREPDLRVRIEGFTDNSGDKAENLVLSQKRASAVATWLLLHGIDKSRISIQGWGEARPIADNSTPEGQAKNRRIELVKF
jgi:outer membrane protein OmpA-like peptidoglycan-associated protein